MSTELATVFQTNALAERATSGTAALAKAMVESSFIVAMQQPRNWMDVRAEVMQAAKRPKFADKGTWTRKVWDSDEGREKILNGLSIRAVEAALQAMGNLLILSEVVHETDEERTIVTRIIDTQKNINYSRPTVLRKIVERRKIRPGQIVEGERETSDGNRVYLVRATEDEMRNKTANAESRAINALGRRLLPVDLQEDLLEAIMETKTAEVKQDPAAALKKMTDAFASIGIMPSDLEKALGHKIERITPDEIVELRGVYTAIKDGETTWEAYSAIDVQVVEKAKVDLSAMKSVAPDEPEAAPKPKKGQSRKMATEIALADPVELYNGLLAELTENGAAYVDQLMAEKWGTSRIGDIPPMLHIDLAAWISDDLVKELKQENFLPM